jgi:hypothetical protein
MSKWPLPNMRIFFTTMKGLISCREKVRTNESIVSRFYERTPQVVPKLINQSAKLLNVESVQIDFG